jgi:hypothetical protein
MIDLALPGDPDIVLIAAADDQGGAQLRRRAFGAREESDAEQNT